MKFISLLITALIVGALVYQQLNTTNTTSPSIAEEQSSPQQPKIPVAPKDVPQFEKDVNQYVDEISDKRKAQLEEMLER